MHQGLSIAKLSLLLILLSAPMSVAQNRVTYGEVIQSLNQTAQTAQRIGIDTAAVRRDIEARIQAEGDENARAAPPVAEILSRLPNFVVQIQFEFDSDVIRSESWVTVGRIADALHHPLLSGSRFLIVGHTDAKGTRRYNLDLSERRALSVADMLVSVFRVPARQLIGLGLGEEQLFDRDNPEDGVNRRVEIINIGPA